MVVPLCICRYLETKTLKEVKIHGLKTCYVEDLSRGLAHSHSDHQNSAVSLTCMDNFEPGEYVLGLCCS